MNGPGPYDDPDLFTRYAAMRAADGTLNDVVEVPALRSLLPAVLGARIADLGCGAGGMCRWFHAQGAASVTGYDASRRMLDLARREAGDDSAVRYELRAIEDIAFAPGRLDLVVSGLALHYVASFDLVAENVARALRRGGSFVFSVEHPVVTCHERRWHDGPEGERLHWPVDRYSEEGPRRIRWLGRDGVPRQHRTVASYLNGLLDAGFSIRRMLEPAPGPNEVTQWPGLGRHRRRPPFLLVRADMV